VQQAGRVMNITTSPRIWSFPKFLGVVHKANEIIEREAGRKSEGLAVYWSLTPAEVEDGKSLRLTVVNAVCPQSPFTLADLTDLQLLRQKLRKWCGGGDGPESASVAS
jgi:hypothetical protein